MIISVFMSRAFAGILLTGSVLLLARLSDVATFGRVSSVLAAGLFATAFLDFGLTQFILRQRALSENETVATALRLAKYTAVLLGITMVATASALGLPLIPSLLIGLGVALDKYADNWQSVLIADGRTELSGLLLISRRAALLITQGVGFSTDSSALFAFSMGFMVAGVLMIPARKKLVPAELLQRSSEPKLKILRLSFFYWLAVTSSQMRELDGILVLLVANPFVAGLYNAANRLVRPLFFVFLAAANVLLPELSRRGQSSANRAARVTLVVGVSGMAIGGVISPFSSSVVELALGTSYAAAGQVFAILLIAAAPHGASSLLGGILQSQGFDRFVAASGIVSGVLLLGATVVGASMAGATGAALAAALVAVARFAYMAYMALRLMPRQEHS
jgi:O-antigen/teichoic acid export membrane protein